MCARNTLGTLEGFNNCISVNKLFRRQSCSQKGDQYCTVMWESEVGVKSVIDSCQSVGFIGVPFTVDVVRKAHEVLSQSLGCRKISQKKGKKTPLCKFIL